MLTIATWNINSINARLPLLLSWLASASPDVVLLQELKCQEASFPAEALEAAGYHAAVVGQKSYNGVALLSRLPFTVTAKALPNGQDDEQARYVEAIVDDRVRVASLYLPNGNPAPGDKFTYKLAWMDRLAEHARNLLRTQEAVVLGGDYNICPTDQDVWNPALFADDALCRPESRGKFRAIVYQGWTEAFSAMRQGQDHYTFFDYQARAWELRHGLRIDHFLLSPRAADSLAACEIDLAPRAWEKPSDHVPVICRLDI